MKDAIRKRKQTNAMINNSVIPAVDALAIFSVPFNPTALAVWFAIKNLYRLYADSSMGEVNEFYKEIDKKLTKLRLDISTDDNFKKGLLFQTEEIIKTRGKDKIKILKRVFLNGFMTAEDKENFELEKMNATIRLMTLENFEFLKNIVKDIEQKPEKALRAIYRMDNYHEQLETLTSLGILIKGELPRERVNLIVEEINKNPRNSKVSWLDYSGEIYYCLSIFGQKILKCISN